MKRRKFIRSGGLLAIPALNVNNLLGKPPSSMENSLTEKTREIPVVGNYDVIICGAGPAGVTAAIEAGRTGAKTLLLEVHGCLGGVWTAGLLTWILDNKNKSGIMEEIITSLKQMQAVSDIPTGSSISFDAELMKVLLEQMCLEARVDVQYFTRAVATSIDSKNRITHVITESKSGREAWGGKVFIDASGDGDLAALSGCSFDLGNEKGEMQPFSLLAMVGGVRVDEIKEFVRWEGDSGQQSKSRLVEQIVKAGILPSYTKPGLYPVRDDLFMFMGNHEYGYSSLNAKEISKATLHARAELHSIINGLQSLGGPWKSLKLISTAEQIGVREGRRIHGLYQVTQKDLISGIRHNDAVCRVNFGVDVHSVKKEGEKKGSYNQGIKSKPYDIPLRALIAKDVNGLMMAGRCISGDFIAHSSYRVTGNSVPMGQAAGKVAAMAALENKLPQDIKWQETGLESGK
ncbi:FAD-dependent oxidoreductase [Flexithrix dorotheae]|uniref:FAD-dependent oxidoreductase n=1 Tax=Flexithrix dorotheae TaxID=70993 RepID=UPI0003769C59|nr:FAD-dependent oxidoreductase [Flexithrix dorotheae]